MNENILSYVLAIACIAILGTQFHLNNKLRKSGNGYVSRPIKTILTIIVLIISLYAIVTGQTYSDVVILIENMF